MGVEIKLKSMEREKVLVWRNWLLNHTPRSIFAFTF
jgi:hypothetical protein